MEQSNLTTLDLRRDDLLPILFSLKCLGMKVQYSKAYFHLGSIKSCWMMSTYYF